MIKRATVSLDSFADQVQCPANQCWYKVLEKLLEEVMALMNQSLVLPLMILTWLQWYPVKICYENMLLKNESVTEFEQEHLLTPCKRGMIIQQQQRLLSLKQQQHFDCGTWRQWKQDIKASAIQLSERKFCFFRIKSLTYKTISASNEWCNCHSNFHFSSI